MIVVIYNVGSVSYAAPALEVLRDYFGKYHIDYHVVEDLQGFNTKGAHPSWMKLLSHKLFPGHGFILNWDLDLLPQKDCPSITEVIDEKRMNLAVDSSLLAGFSGFNVNFKYNGGLMGIPAGLAAWCAAIYEQHAPGTMPSYEQYYLNDALVGGGIAVHRLPDAYNVLYPRNDAGRVLWHDSKVRHYTFGVMEEHVKLKLIVEHRDDYFRT